MPTLRAVAAVPVGAAKDAAELDPSRLAVTLSLAELRALVADAVAEAVAEVIPATNETALTLSGAEMAQRLGVSRSTMAVLRGEGCPCLKLGDSFRFEPERVMVWLRERGGR